MRRSLVLAIALAAACGTPAESPAPAVCTDTCAALLGKEAPDSGELQGVACHLQSIRVTDPNGGEAAPLGEEQCVNRCRDLARRRPFECVEAVLVEGKAAGECSKQGPSGALMDRISGCLSINACTQAQLAIGACYGAAATAAIADPGTGCTAKLSAWKPCLTCLNGRVCTQFCQDCVAACQVPGTSTDSCIPAGGSGGGGAGGGGSGGGGAGGGGSGGA